MDPGITSLLSRWKLGDRSVEQQLLTQVYPMLKRVAASQVRKNDGLLTLQATELVNEAYERLAEQQQVDWQNRGHFLAIAATVIRRVVVDHIRMRTRVKRGSGEAALSLDAVDLERVDGSDHDALARWLALDQGLSDLQTVDPDAVRVVEMRAFGGLSLEEVACVLGCSTATVGRKWRFARALLADRLEMSPGATE